MGTRFFVSIGFLVCMEQEFVLPGNRALDLLSGAGYTGEAGKIRLKLPAFSSVILKKETVQ